MMEENVTITEEVSTDVVEVPETEVETDVDEMSDDELDSFLDGDTTPAVDDDSDADDVSEAEEVEASLDDLYITQNQSKDATLDKPVLIKINGVTHKIDNVDEMRNLMERGLNHTQKMQELAKQRKEFEADSNRVDDEPSTVTQDATAVEVDEIANDILNSSYAESFQDDVSTLPSSVRNDLGQNPQMLRGLSIDYQSGLAQKVVPQVAREMAVKGVSFKDAYMSIANKLNQQSQATEASRNTLASQPKQNTNGVAQSQDVDSMSDKDFDKYFAKM